MKKMSIFRILVSVCSVSQCLLQATVGSAKDAFDSAKTVQEVIEETVEQLAFLEDNKISQETTVRIVEARAAKILHEKNVQPNIAVMLEWTAYVSLLRLGGFHIFKKHKDFAKVKTTITTKSEARALLRTMVNLKTILPMKRMHEEASRRTSTHFLLPKNVLKLIRCFILLTDEGIERVSKLDMHEKFIELTFPPWLQTFVDLVKEDTRLKSEFEQLLNTEEETELFVTPPGGDCLSVPIVASTLTLYYLGDLSALEDKNYVRLRAMIHVANEGNGEEAEKLNQIFQIALRAAMDNVFGDADTFEGGIFSHISKLMESDPLLWERIEDAESEVANDLRAPSILAQHSL